jgi:hypothetical protein
MRLWPRRMLSVVSDDVRGVVARVGRVCGGHDQRVADRLRLDVLVRRTLVRESYEDLQYFSFRRGSLLPAGTAVVRSICCAWGQGGDAASLGRGDHDATLLPVRRAFVVLGTQGVAQLM